jgi:uncharacterized RDD family membrane protein YckC
VIWEIDEAPRVIEGIDDRGRPIPSYAASLGLRPAPFGRRAAATAIEIAVVVILLLPFLVGALPAVIGLVGSPDPQQQLAETPLVLIVVCTVASSVLTTVFIVVQMVLHGRRGVTLGKALVGIRSVNVRTLERPGFWRGEVVRYLVMVASFIVPVVGPVLVIAVSPFFDTERRGRGWPDLAGATWFVDVRHGLNPYDIKRMRIARKTAAANLEDDRRPLPSLATPVTAETPGAYVPVARSSGGVIGARRADVPAAEATPTASTESAAAIGAGAAAAPGAPHGTEWASAAPASQNPSPVRSAPPDLITAVPGASAPRAVVVAVRLDTGETIAIEGGGLLIGRAPAAAPGEHGMQLLALPDDGRSVSKTHLALLRSGDRLVAMDRASTNGSSLVRAGIEHPLAPGEGFETADGDTIRFGDRSAQVMIGRPGPGEEKA